MTVQILEVTVEHTVRFLDFENAVTPLVSGCSGIQDCIQLKGPSGEGQTDIGLGKIRATVIGLRPGALRSAGPFFVYKLALDCEPATLWTGALSNARYDTVTSPELLLLENERFHTAYQDYFKRKRGNFFRSVTEFNGLWDGLQLLNDIWLREFSDLEHLRDQHHLLPKLIFSAAHGRFLTAIELGFSCCIGDAYSVVRDGIEAVVHAHKIVSEPATASAWSNKHKGKAEETAYKQIFEEKKKENLFPEKHGLRKFHAYYAQFSEMATHTSVTSVGKSFEDASTTGNVRWVFHYFETNPQRLASFLNALLQVAAHMEEAFFGCFETRLNLDPELVKMRDEFLRIRQQQTRYLWDTYKLGSL